MACIPQSPHENRTMRILKLKSQLTVTPVFMILLSHITDLYQNITMVPTNMYNKTPFLKKHWSKIINKLGTHEEIHKNGDNEVLGVPLNVCEDSGHTFHVQDKRKSQGAQGILFLKTLKFNLPKLPSRTGYIHRRQTVVGHSSTGVTR